MTTIAFVNCDTCDDGDRKAVPYTDITLVCNQDTEKWTCLLYTSSFHE